MSEPNGPSERILVVEDDAKLRAVLQEVLGARGFEVLASPDAAHALETLQREPVDLVLTDLMMPGMGGDQLLAQVRAAFADVPVIAITAFGTPEGAAALTRAGAADFLTKPFRTPALFAAVERVLAETRPRREAARARQRLGTHLEGLIGRSRPMRELFERIGRVAPSRAPVLITGETGSGKELVAQAVHRASGRGTFVAINCGAIPPNLLEAELFGHVRGAFTGAEREKAGLFQAADGGTLLLDEVAELPLALQPKLLRALQEREVRRVGAVQSQPVDVRVLAATHRDLGGEVRAGRFREDLYYRLNVLRLHVPPLRERPADIPLLTERLLEQIAARDGRPTLVVAPAALAALVAYPWPGNVRELLNVVERAAVFADGPEIRLRDLPDEIAARAPAAAAAPAPPLTHAPPAAPPAASPAPPADPVRDAVERGLTLDELEREYILAALERAGGNRTRTAELLGIPRRTLYRRLAEYGVLEEG